MNQELSLSVNHVLIGVFILGLSVGFAGGVATQSTTLTQSTNNLNVGDNPNNANKGDQNTGSSEVVELSNTEFAYDGVEAGIGDGEYTVNGKTFSLEGEPYLGSGDADVKMVAFEDFECPFCKRYNTRTFPSIMSNHVEKGEVQYYLKNFPLTQIHPWAVKGGIASECALNQDPEAFWIYKDGFFNNQDKLNQLWKNNPSSFDKTMKRWAEQIGLDTQQFNQCYDNQEELEEVKQDQQEGVSKDVSGTPTVFVDDEKLVGAQPYSRFKSAIQQ